MTLDDVMGIAFDVGDEMRHGDEGGERASDRLRSAIVSYANDAARAAYQDAARMCREQAELWTGTVYWRGLCYAAKQLDQRAEKAP